LCSPNDSFDASGDTSDGALVSGLRIGLRIDYDDGSLSASTTTRMAKRHVEEKRKVADALIH
jgi:hypothetical protein